MKYKNTRFTVDLKENIAELERELQNTGIELTRESNNPFEPGYDSSMTIGESDKEGRIN